MYHFAGRLPLRWKRAFNRKFFFTSGACLLNEKELTYYSVANKTYSSMDLSIVSNTLMPYLDWNVKNTYRSDHFPIVLNITEQAESFPHVPLWKVESVNWVLFREIAYLWWDDIAGLNIDDAVAYLTGCIIEAATKCIQQTNGLANKRCISWWNDECKEARKKENRLLRDSPTAKNVINFKQAKSQCRTRRRA